MENTAHSQDHDSTYAPITIIELAQQLGHANTDAIRKQWQSLEIDRAFTRYLELTEQEYNAILKYYAGRKNEQAAKMLAGLPFTPDLLPAPRAAQVRYSLQDGRTTERTEEPPRRYSAASTTTDQPANVSSSRRSSNGTVRAPGFFRRYLSALIQSVAVLCLIISSVISVADIIRESTPIGGWSYVVALVICSSPLLILSAGEKLNPLIAYSIMLVTLMVEIFCNAIAINRHTSQAFIGQVNHATAFNDITLAWSLGIGLPILALLFEISLLNIIKRS